MTIMYWYHQHAPWYIIQGKGRNFARFNLVNKRNENESQISVCSQNYFNTQVPSDFYPYSMFRIFWAFRGLRKIQQHPGTSEVIQLRLLNWCLKIETEEEFPTRKVHSSTKDRCYSHIGSSEWPTYIPIPSSTPTPSRRLKIAGPEINLDTWTYLAHRRCVQ